MTQFLTRTAQTYSETSLQSTILINNIIIAFTFTKSSSSKIGRNFQSVFNVAVASHSQNLDKTFDQSLKLQRRCSFVKNWSKYVVNFRRRCDVKRLNNLIPIFDVIVSSKVGQKLRPIIDVTTTSLRRQILTVNFDRSLTSQQCCSFVENWSKFSTLE